MRIFIPSYKRAGKVNTRKTLGGRGVIVCHEFEAKEYEKEEGGELMVVPDALRGNIAKVRNYILDHAGDPEVVMMDDDISCIGYQESMIQFPMIPEQIMGFLQLGYQMARDIGTPLWGVNLQSDPKFYREYSPFSFLSPVLGTFSCHLDPSLRYDESLYLNEDYDFFLKTIKQARVVLRFNKYYYMADHLNKEGGCGAYRMKEFEMEQAKVMVKRWGPVVVKFDIGKSTNCRVRVPLKGI